jgi:hypothetical protein
LTIIKWRVQIISNEEILTKMDAKKGIIFDDSIMRVLGEYIAQQGTVEEAPTMDCSVFALARGMELAEDIISASGINLLRQGGVLDQETLDKTLKFHNVDPISGIIKVKQLS